MASQQSIGRDVFEYIAPADRELARAQMALAQATGRTTSYALTDAAGTNNQPASYVTQVAPVQEPDGSVGLCLAAVDITEQKNRERVLTEGEESLRFALEATGFGLWSWDLRSDEVVWDDNMRKLHGYAQPVSPSAYSRTLVHPDDRELVDHGAETTGATGSFHQSPAYRVVLADGRTRWLLTMGRTVQDSDGRVVRMIGGSIDVTRVHELEDQLRQSQKMEAIGSLTAGVAHNFNNMLAAILPTLELAIPLVPEPRANLLRQASHAARRASELVQQLMTYAGQSNTQRHTVCSVDAIVEAAASICRRTFDGHLALSVEREGSTLSVECDAIQIEQVLVNLLLNARDSILESQVALGRISVRIYRSPVPLSGKLSSDPLRPAVCIDITDNGVGISELVQARIFEPFFTTKPAGKGTGLGLATSYAIVRDHDGTLTCESTPGRAPPFSICLPLSTRVRAESNEAAVRGSAPVGARVLLVDDDDAVRSALSHVLNASGLVVFEAASGPAALQILLSEREIDVILLDRSMPGGQGERFIPRLRELSPRARLMSVGPGRRARAGSPGRCGGAQARGRRQPARRHRPRARPLALSAAERSAVEGSSATEKVSQLNSRHSRSPFQSACSCGGLVRIAWASCGRGRSRTRGAREARRSCAPACSRTLAARRVARRRADW